ncbi:MAG TPA: hypothetical protein VMW08_18655 [Acidimicrobiales bacterium]|nr:hypothetical protein [Acidimicrobiales bacterium]
MDDPADGVENGTAARAGTPIEASPPLPTGQQGEGPPQESVDPGSVPSGTGSAIARAAAAVGTLFILGFLLGYIASRYFGGG